MSSWDSPSVVLFTHLPSLVSTGLRCLATISLLFLIIFSTPTPPTDRQTSERVFSNMVGDLLWRWLVEQASGRR